MKFIRFVLPFLFVRNWYTGAHEFSRARFLIFSGIAIMLFLGFCIAYILQAPVVIVNSEI